MTQHAILVTGAAGFIGFHVAQRLLSSGREVVGLDCINSYYDPALKHARLEMLKRHPNFTFVKADLAERDTTKALFENSSSTFLPMLTRSLMRPAVASSGLSVVRAFTRGSKATLPPVGP